MGEKRKLILRSVLDCIFIVLMCLALHIHYGYLYVIFSYAACSKAFGSRKSYFSHHKRELKPLEVIAWFVIGFSGIGVIGFIISSGLVKNVGFIIPMGMLLLGLRLLDFAKEWNLATVGRDQKAKPGF